MGNRFTLPLILVAALLAAGAIFWLSGGERGAARPVAPAANVLAKAETTETPLVEPVSAPAVATASDKDARIEVAPTTQPKTKPDAAKSKSERLTRVRGQVLDPAGKPVAKARVLASEQMGFPLDLDARAELPWLERRETETDAEGRFTLEDVDSGELQMAVRAPGFAPFDRQGIDVPADESVELQPFELTRGAILAGMVVDPRGRGVAGAEIVRRDPHEVGGFAFFGRREPSAITAADGSFRIDQIACGAWRFSVHSEEHPDLSVEGIADLPGVEQGGLRWQLSAGAVIQGTVSGIPADEQGELEVRAMRGNLGGEFVVGVPSRTAPIAKDGSFAVHGLEIGQSYDLQARRSDRAENGFWERSRSNNVSARSGDTGVLLTYQPEAALVFRVTDSNGKPLERFQVEAGIDWPAPLRDDEGRPRALFPEGNVRVGGLRPSGSDERVQLVVNATGFREFRREDIALRAGQELDLGLIQLDPVPIVRVHVLDHENGEPLAGALVRIEKDMGGQLSVRHSIEIGDSGGEESVEIGDGRSARTDEQGWAEITSFEGETVKLTARASGYAPAELGGLFLPEGKVVEQELRLSRGGEALVHVLDSEGVALAGARVQHRAPNAPEMFVMGGRSGGNVTDSAGEVVFENLEPGRHSFRIDEGGGGGPMFASADQVVIAGLGGGGGGESWSEIEVVEGERAELTLRAAPRGGLSGRVRESGKVLAGATVRLESEDAGDGPRFRLPGMDSGPQGRTDGEGRYRLDDLKEGRYKLSVEHPTRRMAQEFSVEVRPGDNVFDVDLPLSIIEGRVVDQEKKPLAGIRVWPERHSGESGGPQGRFAMIMIDDGGDGNVMTSGELGGNSVLTDAEGRYALRGVASDVDLVIKAEGDTVQPASSEVVRVAPDQVKSSVDLELEAGGAITVQAELGDGAPARFCIVEARFLGEAEPALEPKISFIQSGSTTLKGLKPGRWNVSVRKADGQRSETPDDEQEVEVEAGATATATLVLE